MHNSGESGVRRNKTHGHSTRMVLSSQISIPIALRATRVSAVLRGRKDNDTYDHKLSITIKHSNIYIPVTSSETERPP